MKPFFLTVALGIISAYDSECTNWSTTKCAGEGQTCTCGTEIFYGAPGRDTNQGHKILAVPSGSDGMSCTSDPFGGDPLVGTIKDCYCCADMRVLPDIFKSDIVVKSHYPVAHNAGSTEGWRRAPGACFFADPIAKRTSTEYFVINGERTNDNFANDCLEWTFTKNGDSYRVKVEDPFFEDEKWNPGYLAEQKDSTVDPVNGDNRLSISTNPVTQWKLHYFTGGYKLESVGLDGSTQTPNAGYALSLGGQGTTATDNFLDAAQKLTNVVVVADGTNKATIYSIKLPEVTTGASYLAGSATALMAVALYYM